MSRWDDDDEPRLDERRAIAPEVGKHRSRKNTRRWCRGKNGVEHELEVRLSKNSQLMHNREQPCYRPYWGRQSWWCAHERYCTRCGKILDWTLGDACPAFTIEITRHQRRRYE